MSIRKKPKNQRTTYTYHFADGRIVTLYPESRRPRDEAEITICEKLYVDDALIAELHRADDRIVYNDLKNSKAPVADWQKPGIEAWERDHPGTKAPKNWNLSLDAVIGEDVASDKLSILAQLSPAEKEDPPEVERLRSIVGEFTDQEKRIYHLVFRIGRSGREAGRILNIPESTIRRRIKDIRERIASDPVLKKIFEKK